MGKSAIELYEYAYKGRKSPDTKLLLMGEMPESRYKRFAISEFNLDNPGGFEIKNCWVWFPVGSFSRIKPLVKFVLGGSIQNCSFFFFKTPSKRTNLIFSVKGGGHSGVFFSTHKMSLFTVMTGKDANLTIGDAVYIGGARLGLDNTEMVVGAGGLWSDTILVQGTDNHGVFDLETMRHVNTERKHVILKRRVWLGRQVTVMKNVSIGEGSIVATGAIVTKDMPKACAVAGVPAKVVKRRVSWTHRQETVYDYERDALEQLSKETQDDAILSL